jgi:GNAT superfamily N-acetyltransferase
MLIRNARPGDLRCLAAMARALSRHESSCAPTLNVRVLTTREWARHLSPRLKRSRNSRVVVAEEKGAVIGYAVGNVVKPVFFKVRRLGMIDACFVDPAHRKAGIGKSLVDALFDWFRDKGIRTVDLGALRSNPGFRFWRKLGFREFYVRMRRRLP